MAEIRVAPGTTMLEALVKTPQVGVCELVWNAFDEDATWVRISVERNELGGLSLIHVEDNGSGMNRQRAEEVFSRVGDSWKIRTTKSSGGRAVHGKHGRGRYAAFSLGASVNWVSTASAVEGNELATIQVEGQRGHLDRFNITAIALGQDRPGTHVDIGATTKEAHKAFDDVTKLTQRLLTEFALCLDRYVDFEIEFLGTKIDPSAAIAAKQVLDVPVPDGVDGPVSLTVIEWNLSNVERRLYLCNADSHVTGEMPPRIQAVGAEFTAYLSWDGFPHDAELLLEDDTQTDVGKVVSAGRAALRTHLSQAAHRREAETIQRWRNEGVYPYVNKPQGAVERATQETFKVVAMAASRTLEEAKSFESKAMALCLLKETFENDPEALLPILQKFTKLSTARINELSGLLERTTLSHLITLGREVSDRIDLLHGLNALIFDTETKKAMLERTQLHRILANETWVFGEEWSLTGDDDRLNEVLRRYLHELGADVRLADKAPIVREDGRAAIPDLVLGRQLETRENQFTHLVVELKRPNHRLIDADISQLRSYASAITNDERFDQPNSEWEFWLIGNITQTSVDEQRNQDSLPFGVVQSGKKYRLIVRTWAEVLGDAQHRLKFVQKSLKYESNRDAGLASMRERYRDFLPSEALAAGADASSMNHSEPA